MQAQLACMLLLCFTCCGLCTGRNRDQRALEEELLSSVFASKVKMKQNKQVAPYWRASLANLCRMVSGLWQETWSGEEQEPGELREGALQLLQELYSLQHICRALHNSLDYLDENGDTPLKRKSPYILKRQATQSTKSRRPYILKRSMIY
uniref:Neurotensin/neuromedin N n=1 Tax=Echeneis naucrates TaxID=173247 RepID=A0A665VVX0_ECHNA